jgi:hypothetical protein
MTPETPDPERDHLRAKIRDLLLKHYEHQVADDAHRIEERPAALKEIDKRLDDLFRPLFT